MPTSSSRSFRADIYTPHPYDLYDLYDLAHVAGWGAYNLHELGHVSWVRSVMYRCCTAYETAGYDLDVDRDLSDACKRKCFKRQHVGGTAKKLGGG